MSVNELIFMAEKVRLPTWRERNWTQKLEDSAEYQAQTLRTRDSHPWDVQGLLTSKEGLVKNEVSRNLL